MWTFPVIDGAVAYGVYRLYKRYKRYQTVKTDRAHNLRMAMTANPRKKARKGPLRTPRRKGLDELATKAYVQKVVKAKPELKCYSENSFSGVALNIGTIRFDNCVANITQGSDYGNRIGDTIHVPRISIFQRWHNTNTDTPVYIRFLVCIDKYTIAATDVGTDMFASRFQSSNDPLDYVSDGRTDQIHMPINRVRYEVLYNKSFKLGTIQPANDANLACEKFILASVPVNRTFKYTSGSVIPSLSAFPGLTIMWFVESQGNIGALTNGIENSFCWKVWFTDS